MWWVIDSVQPVYNTYNQRISEREQASLTIEAPKYSITRTFLLNHTDGTPVRFHLVKFECCNRIGGMVKNGELYMGYLNEVQVNQLGTTTLQMVPEIEISILVHELFHLGSMNVLKYCADFSTNVCQEKGAYNVEYLYEQIRSLGEDGFFRLNK
jgi:hypothetical protein